MRIFLKRLSLKRKKKTIIFNFFFFCKIKLTIYRALSRLEPALYIIQDSLHVVGTMATLREAYPFLVQVQRIGALEQFMLSKSDKSFHEKEDCTKVSILLTPLESRSLHPV